jgi:hypothetical protein
MEFVDCRRHADVKCRSVSCQLRANHTGQLSMVVLKSLAFTCCNWTAIVMSNTPPSLRCARCASKLPPSIRARLTTDPLLQEEHSSPRLLLMTSQSRQKTAFQRGRMFSSGWWFLKAVDIQSNPCRWECGGSYIRRQNTVSCQVHNLSQVSVLGAKRSALRDNRTPK